MKKKNLKEILLQKVTAIHVKKKLKGLENTHSLDVRSKGKLKPDIDTLQK